MDAPNLLYSVKKAYFRITTSISFYPFLISLSLLGFAWFIVYLDKISVGGWFINMLPFLKIDNPDTARSLLSSLLTGLISLVTFTFAMVMIVLSQVVTSYSPRVLPDLVSRKGNQVVLGVMMGSICFIIVALSNIQTFNASAQVPLLSVATGTYLGFTSLLAFIYFIHQISNDIQIGNILNTIYRNTKKVLDVELDSESYQDIETKGETSYIVHAWNSGYFNKITEKDFLHAASKMGLKIKLLKVQGMYLLKGDPFLEINKPLTSDIAQLLKENVVLRHQENIEENFLYGFKQITEIAVKALSPSINDPGTAINAIDLLSDLLCRLQRLTGRKVLQDKHGNASILYAPIQFDVTFYMCLASIRAYSSTDVTVQTRLIDLISKLCERDDANKHSTLFKKELNSIEEASSKEMNSKEDIAYINTLLQSARSQLQLS